MSKAFFWFEIIIYDANVESKSVGIDQVINSYQLIIQSGMNVFNVTVGCKISCIVSKMNKTHLIWENAHASDTVKRRGPNSEPCGTPNVMFDIEQVQFLIETYCFLLLK